MTATALDRRRPAEHAPEHTDDWDRALDLLRTPLADGRTVIEHTVVDGVTYWWFYDHLFRKAMSAPTGLAGAHAGLLVRGARRTAERVPLMPLMHAALGRNAARQARMLMGDRDDEDLPRPADALFTAQNRTWTGHNDGFWGPIWQALEREGVAHVVTTYPVEGGRWPWPGGGGARVLKERLEHQRWPHLPFDLFWTTAGAARERQVKRQLVRHWRDVCDDEVLWRLMDGFGSKAPLAWSLLRHAFHLYMPRFATILDMAERLLHTVRPRVLVLLNEAGSFERALVTAAKRRGIRSIALQHGVIHARHPSYALPIGHIAPDVSLDPPHAPIVDETCVYGQFHQGLLQRLGYPAQALTATGNPKNDALRAMAAGTDRVELLRGLGLDPTKPTVVWTTQTHGWTDVENEAYRRAMRSWMEQAGDGAQTIFKLHPGEDPRGTSYRTDLDMQDAQDAADGPHVIARSRRFPAVIVHPRLDTTRTMAACDLVITKNSTTGMEAVALGKPLVVLNLSGDPDLIDYVERGVADGVYEGTELSGVIRRLLQTDDEQAAHREAYLERYMGPMDGHAIDRFVARVQTHMEH